MRKKLIFVGLGILLTGSIVFGVIYYQRSTSAELSKKDIQVTKKPVIPRKQPVYRLNMLKNAEFTANTPVAIEFEIRDENNKVLKAFDTEYKEPMHIMVVRKDRSNFQHLHPALDKTSGKFTLANFTLPLDGDYRVLADFTSSEAAKDDLGVKISSAPYIDIKTAGGPGVAQPLSIDKLTSSVNGFTADISPLIGDSAGVTKTIIANEPIVLINNINKDGVPYKNLETIYGALGHFISFGPNLEYLHAHPTFDEKIPQTGSLSFLAHFTSPGQYKIYVQTKADGQVNTAEYNLTVAPDPVKKAE
ncbi:MAG: hypothetical protein WAW80_04245 [Candidatus Saccharimonadales bacterium]